MTPDATPMTLDALPATPPRSERPARQSLTRSAALTAIASLLDYAAQLVAMLVVTPILVTALGRSLYGVWEMLRQSVTYMTATDGRPTDALRLMIANQQANEDVAAKRRYVGAALVVWVLFLPLMLVGGGILVWVTPRITKLAPAFHGSVRVTCALLVLSFLVATLGSVPEAVLRGMNLGYKRMGLQASLSLVGGLLFAGAVTAGFGLQGLGAAQLLVAVLTGVCFWVLVKQYVPAYGVARPARPEVKSLLNMSAWLTGGTIISHLLASSDVIILGVVLSPAVVATYVLTCAAARTVLGIFDFAVGAAIPGVAGVIGAGQYERAGRLRTELILLTWLFVTGAGATILVWNRSFLDLWVGPQHYAGTWANLLIMCIAGEVAFVRSYQHIIDASLRPRPRVVVTAVSAVVMVVTSLLLTRHLGIVGLCLGIVAGRTTQFLAYPLLVAAVLHEPRTVPLRRILRPLVTTLALFALATALGERLVVHHWIEWVGVVAVSGGVFVAVALVAGLAAPARRTVVRRCLALGRSSLG